MQYFVYFCILKPYCAVTKIRLRHFVLVLATLTLLVGCGEKGVVTTLDVLPTPAYQNVKEGTFTFSGSTRICFYNMGQNSETARYVTRSLRKMHFRPSLSGSICDNCLVFSLNDTTASDLGDEGYCLEVNGAGIHVSANTETGLFYGYQTLLQLLPNDIARTRYSKIVLPQCIIIDAPRFVWRGSHLDVSRHFFSVKAVKAHLDLMAMYKLNRFHWHLTDDHGWRIEIDKYPELNDVGSWRVDRSDVPWGEALPAQEGEPTNYGGYYTKEEIRDVVQYAAERHIEVIPEVEIPGHCAAILASYPEFGCQEDDTTYQVQIGPYWPPRAILCAGSDTVIQFLCDIMDELVPLFPSTYFHIGGDEALKDNWRRCPRCQARLRELGYDDEEQLQGWMIGRVENYLKHHGKRIVGWDEMLNSSVSPEATVMSWQGMQGGLRAAARGNDVVMAPTEFCYLDYCQGNPGYQPLAMPCELSLRKVYDFDPAPTSMPASDARHVLGGQANLWTEYINTLEHAQYMLLPRLCAVAECVWTPRDKKDWYAFRRKLVGHKQRFAALGYNFCEGSFKPVAFTRQNTDGTYQVTLDWEVEGTLVYYSVDSNPTEETNRQLYTAPFNVPEGSVVYTISFYDGKQREEVYNFPIGKR